MLLMEVKTNKKTSFGPHNGCYCGDNEVENTKNTRYLRITP